MMGFYECLDLFDHLLNLVKTLIKKGFSWNLALDSWNELLYHPIGIIMLIHVIPLAYGLKLFFCVIFLGLNLNICMRIDSVQNMVLTHSLLLNGYLLQNINPLLILTRTLIKKNLLGRPWQITIKIFRGKQSSVLMFWLIEVIIHKYFMTFVPNFCLSVLIGTILGFLFGAS
jgi:hypothetical protein